MPRPSRTKPTREESSDLSSAVSDAPEPTTFPDDSNGIRGTKRKRQLKQKTTQVVQEDEEQEEKATPIKKTRQRKSVKVEQAISPPPPKRA
ncbi:hypothetical protein KCU73_g7465, partial [Aureobasidium melanogenum]